MRLARLHAQFVRQEKHVQHRMLPIRSRVQRLRPILRKVQLHAMMSRQELSGQVQPWTIHSISILQHSAMKVNLPSKRVELPAQTAQQVNSASLRTETQWIVMQRGSLRWRLQLVPSHKETMQ